MTERLTRDQQEGILDFYFRCGSEERIAEARDLIASNPEAAELYANFEKTLKQLDTVKYEPCPENLVELTVSRLKLAAAEKMADLKTAQDSKQHVEKLTLAAVAANESQETLGTLIAREQQQAWTRPDDQGTIISMSNTGFWLRFGKGVAAAAVFMIVGTVLMTTLNYMRQFSAKVQCNKQLAGVFQGLSNYSSDHDGLMPAVAASTGAPWYKVGDQGDDNHSNTRNMWLLVRDGYVDAQDFICPGSGLSRKIQFDPAKLKDFPNRGNVTYSFRIVPSVPIQMRIAGQTALMADLNPVFEKLPPVINGRLQLKLDQGLATINSSNHGRKGQNVLFGDGSVKFVKTRAVGLANDDIFTLQNTDLYQGCELPASANDVFLAP
jgi:hypothetical protein